MCIGLIEVHASLTLPLDTSHPFISYIYMLTVPLIHSVLIFICSQSLSSTQFFSYIYSNSYESNKCLFIKEKHTWLMRVLIISVLCIKFLCFQQLPICWWDILGCCLYFLLCFMIRCICEKQKYMFIMFQIVFVKPCFY